MLLCAKPLEYPCTYDTYLAWVSYLVPVSLTLVPYMCPCLSDWLGFHPGLLTDHFLLFCICTLTLSYATQRTATHRNAPVPYLTLRHSALHFNHLHLDLASRHPTLSSQITSPFPDLFEKKRSRSIAITIAIRNPQSIGESSCEQRRFIKGPISRPPMLTLPPCW